MKQAQWAGAIVVLAAMVFAITFAMNFLGGGGGEKKAIVVKEGRQLRFHYAMGPIKGGYVACEPDPKKVYHCDFWFDNNNLEAVKVGLDRTSCKCSAVELYTLNEEGRNLLLGLAAGMAGRAAEPAHPLLGGLWHRLYVVPGTFALEEVVRPRAQEGAEGRELLKGEEAVDVPAGAVGWVRLSWKGQEGETSAFSATLWSQEKGANPQVVQALAAFHKPVRVLPLYELGELKDEDLQSKERRLEVVCWSSTRENFRLAAAPSEGLPRTPASSTFVVGKPVLLTRAQRDRLSERNNDPEQPDHTRRGKVLCAYRVPIALKGLAADGKTPFPIGPFRRVVVLKSDEDVEPLRVEVRGRVVGLVDVGADADGGGLLLGEFSQSQGARGSIAVRSRVPGLTLELDEERTKVAAPFLRVKLLAETKSEEVRQAWELRVVVPPKEAYGKFPRREDPAYEDGAVYLKAREKGKPERTIRVPVAGDALRG